MTSRSRPHGATGKEPGQGSEARLNQPGRAHGNWTWRYRSEMLTDELAAALRDMAIAAGRWLPPGEELEDSPPIELEYGEPDEGPPGGRQVGPARSYV